MADPGNSSGRRGSRSDGVGDRPHRSGDPQRQHRRQQAQATGHHPGQRVVAELGSGRAGSHRGHGRADLVRGEHPAEDHRRVLRPVDLAAQRDRGRHGGDPVQPVEDDKDEQAGMCGGGHEARQHQQGHTAQRVVPAEQQSAVDPVGEPARRDRADDVEDTDEREQAGRRGLRHAIVVGSRDGVRADQTVGRRAADGERPGQQPERPGP